MTGRWCEGTVDGRNGEKKRVEIIKYLYCNNKENERETNHTTNPIPVHGTLFLLRASGAGQQ